MKSILFNVLILGYIVSSVFCDRCSEKEIVYRKGDSQGTYGQFKRLDLFQQPEQLSTAFNELDSCYTLTVLERGSEFISCCYIKVKYRQINNDEKYTVGGCYPLKYDELFNGSFGKSIKEDLEAAIANANAGYIDKVKVDILCNSSSYLKVVGLALLFLLF